MEKDNINNFFENTNFDIRISHNGRWIDQKCTPDVLCIVSDCVLNYIEENGNEIEFTSKDIWKADYTRENVEEIFNKPNTKHAKSENEYDKFFSQPLELLANSRVILKEKRGRNNIYQTNNIELLEYIALKERNALEFLNIYIRKVLLDSDLMKEFEEFFEIQTQESYLNLKEKFEEFTIKNTKINKKLEARRIFTKVINPIAFKEKKLGTYRGRISKNFITYSSLMYNTENFRDKNLEKPKNITRQEWTKIHSQKVNVEYYKYQSKKAKGFLRRYNDKYRNGLSEVNDKDHELATQIHHIFPQHQYPEISMYYENLIALTPNQHFIKAHPNNNTQRINKDYQEILLKSKAGIIEEDIDLKGEKSIYNFDNFIEVLNSGFNTEYKIEENDFITVMDTIEDYYS
ncbi:restriction endonuclease [Staphylococcus hominis]|uniref:restriction endonuclease n=1 Tax=Staphylococcus hominis TaxID=1290 RepID=UPI0011A8119E|nr:restriction endonuclease [Staphylococcus hominis]